MIDWGRIRELRDEIGEDDFAEVADIFFEEIEQVIVRLRNAPNPATYEADLHFLRSSALNLGFSALSGLCHDGERLAASGSAEAVNLAPLFSTYEASKSAFLSG